MRILDINENYILFDNDSKITFSHDRNCCENNYADFSQIEDEALHYDFDEKLIFESVENSGFRFGDGGRMFFIPCYSDQNGYYTSEIDIIYNDNEVLNFGCELRLEED